MSEVHLVSVQVSVPKELADVKDLIVSIASDLKAGEKPMDVMFGSLPKFQKAIEGMGDIPTELKSKEVYTLGAVLLADLLAIFLPVKTDDSAPSPLVAGAAAGVAAGAAAGAVVGQTQA